MKLIVLTLLGVVVCGLLVLVYFTEFGRYLKTVWLIATITPYEQPGGGAGSIYVIGDSTGYGTGVSRSADSVAGRLGNEYTWYRIQNDSVNGRQIVGATDALAKVSGQHDLLLLQIGANDLLANRSVPVVVADMRQLIEQAREKADAVIVISAGNIGAVPYFTGADADRYETASRAYTQAMLALAQEYQDVTYVALFDEPEDDPFLQRPDELLSLDGLHPSSAGYKIWYDKARPYFAAVLDPAS